jgi:hypothetical protein
MCADNIKVIPQDRTVTLKRRVNSEQENQAVEAKAAELASAAHVKSETEVAPKQL